MSGEVPHETRLLWGENIRRERLRAGMSIPAFARLVGTSRQAVWAWEAGLYPPSYANRRRIAQRLGKAGESSASTRRRLFRVFPDWTEEEVSA